MCVRTISYTYLRIVCWQEYYIFRWLFWSTGLAFLLEELVLYVAEGSSRIIGLCKLSSSPLLRRSCESWYRSRCRETERCVVMFKCGWCRGGGECRCFPNTCLQSRWSGLVVYKLVEALIADHEFSVRFRRSQFL